MMTGFPIRQAFALLLAIVLGMVDLAAAHPIMWECGNPGVEPVGMTSEDPDEHLCVASCDIQNYGHSDADNMVSLTFTAPDGYVLDVRYPGFTGWFFAGQEVIPYRNNPQSVTFWWFLRSGDLFHYDICSPSPPAVPVVGTLEAMSQISEHGNDFNTLHVWLPAVPVAEPPTQAVSCVSVERAGAGHVRLAFANGDGNAVLAVANQPDFTPWPGRTYEGGGYGFAAARPHGTGTVTVAGLAAGTAHTFRLFAANTAPGRQPYYLSAPAAATASTLPLGNRGSVRPLFDAIQVVSNRVGLAVLELDTRLWQQIEVSTNGTNWTVETVLNTTTSVVPPAAASTNWSGSMTAPARWYRVRAEW